MDATGGDAAGAAAQSGLMARQDAPDAGVSTPSAVCAYCREPGGVVIWQEAHWRVVRAEEPLFPATYRVVCQHHVAELSRLPDGALHRGLELAVAVERVLLAEGGAHKINVASLGNQVPHLHWHVIARHTDDTHFPDSVWSASRRPADAARLAERRAALPALDDAIAVALRPRG